MIEAILFISGVVLGAYAVVIGGGMFLALPLFQFLFPGALVGQIVGNLKVGSVARGLSSTWATLRYLDLARGMALAAPFAAGSALGAYLIIDADQRWMLALVILAVLVSEFAGRIGRIVDGRIYVGAVFAAGVYGGLIGAGIGLLLVALLRVREPGDEKIAEVKIQARFIEFVMGLGAIVVHLGAGNLAAEIWIPWALGNLVGGAAGGVFLGQMVDFSARFQRKVLLGSYAVALLISLLALFS